ncbi:MAG: hypothetical protein PVH87_21345 [Desulfobacteraceae bacterium]
MEGHPHQDGPDHLAFAGIYADVEKQPPGIRIFPGGAVAVQPWGKNQVAGARLCFVHHSVQKGIEFIHLLRGVRS